MKRILVPLDGSSFAERALGPALHLAARHEAEIHMASVVSDLPPVPLATADSEQATRWVEEERKRAEQYLEEVRERTLGKAPGARLEFHARVGPVTKAIERLADQLEVDLIMLTTHGRGSWQRAWLGSVADQLLRRAEKPLLLLRDQEAGGGLFKASTSPEHVLIPLDGSEAAETVLEVLDPILPEEGGQVTLASVLHQPFPLATTYLPHTTSEQFMMSERKEHLQSYLDEVAERFTDKGVEVETRVLVGEDAAQGLLEVADKAKVDLIALSTRGRGGVTRFFLGSVADKLVRGAKVPLLTARRPGEHGEDD